MDFGKILPWNWGRASAGPVDNVVVMPNTPQIKSAYQIDNFGGYWEETTGIALGENTGSYQTAARRGYQQNSAVFTASAKLTGAAKTVPLVTIVPKDGNDEPDWQHPATRLLARPSGIMGARTYVERLLMHFILAGEFFVYLLRVRGDDLPRELHPLRPDLMDAVVDGKGHVTAWKYTGTEPKTYSAEEILHVKAFNPFSDIRGMPTLMSASLEIASLNSAQQWNHNLLKNGFGSNTALLTDPMDDVQQEDFEDGLRRNTQGPQNAGKPLVAAGIRDVKTMGWNPRNMDWLAGILQNRRQVYGIMNVPPELCGDAGNKAYNSYKEARRALYTEGVLPLLELICDEHGRVLLDSGTDEFLVPYKDNIEALHEEESDKWTRATSGVDNSVLTPNDAREYLGIDKSNDPLADRLLVKAGSVPSDMLGDTETEPTP